MVSWALGQGSPKGAARIAPSRPRYFYTATLTAFTVVVIHSILFRRYFAEGVTRLTRENGG